MNATNQQSLRRFVLVLTIALVTLAVILTACATPPTPTPQPTATAVPPTATPVPPTATRVPPTATAVPPTATRVPPTATPVPPTATATKPPTPTPTPLPKGWVTIKTAQSPSPRTGFAMRMLPDGRLLLFGGMDKDGKKLNDTWVFGPVAKAQRQSPSINLSFALSAGLGGAFAPWLAPQAQNTMQGSAEAWHPLQDVNPPSPRSGHRMAVLPDGKVMLFGGELQDGTLSSELFTFDLKAWELVIRVTGPPPGRFTPIFLANGNNLYVQGGLGKKPNGQLFVYDDFWRHDLKTSTWTELPKPPGYVSANSFATIFPAAAGSQVFFVDPHAYQLAPGINYYYDPAKNTWGQTKSQGDVPAGARSGYSVAFVGDQGIVTGGSLYDPNTKKNNPISEVWAIDLKTGNWTRLGDLPFPISGHGSLHDEKQGRLIVWGLTGEDVGFLTWLTAGRIMPLR
ncbi:MAG: hypothetical protein HY782_06845 [Chloroflexi bacterium]|nr:hypothetical protein [Chloroflexota bacterium]